MKKIVEMIYCHALNFCSFLKMFFFFMKIEWNKRSASVACSRIPCVHKMPKKVFFFCCLILLVLCCTEGLYERKLLECTVNIWFLLKCLYYGLWKINWYRHPIWNGKGIMTSVPAWCVSAQASFVFKIDSQKTQCLLIALNKMQLLKKIILYVEVIF